MSNYTCKVPFCTNIKNNSTRSLYCQPHLNEMNRIKGGAFKDYIPIEFIMKCKIHGLLNKDEVYLQKGPVRKSTNKNSTSKICRYCIRYRQKSYSAKNPIAETERRKRNMLGYKFNLSIDEYNIMLESQKNLCAICHQMEKVIDSRTKKIRNLAVDHCHDTGAVRELLCSKCNNGLGHFKDDIELLQNAINYLRPYK